MNNKSNIKPTWVIETGMFEEDDVCQNLVDIVKSKGCEVREIRYYGFDSDIEGVNDLEDKCVVAMSSLNACKRAKRKHRWYPGYWCDFSRLSCQSYYSHWFEYILNWDGEFVPWQIIKIKIENLYMQYGDKYGEDGTIFIRPDTNDKLFSGELVVKKQFDNFALMIDNYLGEDESPLCVVALPKKIFREWRFYVSEGKIITGSLYKENDKIKYERSWPQEAAELVEKATEKWMPHPICCIDIAEIENHRNGNVEYYIIECGSINCAGMYAADLDKIVDEMNRLAIADWKEYFTDEAEIDNAG